MDNEEIVNSVIKRLEIMLDNRDRISVTDVEKISGYSKRYIQKIFKDITGINISTYIKKRKLTQAAILLKLTKKKIYHIAMDLNFATQQSFTRAFLREFKVSPLTYRNELGFDCSCLFWGPTINLHINDPVKKTIKSLKLKVKEFHYRDALLGSSYSRGKRIRLEETTSILSMKNEAVIVTTLYPSSSLEFEISLASRIGYIDTINYNYETSERLYWEFEYDGIWEEYILFGRFFLFFTEVRFEPLIMECIQLNGKMGDGQQLYHINIYLPIPYD